MNLSGRVAVITGGAGHVAQGFAEALGELGAEICLLDIATDRLRERADALQHVVPSKISWHTTDVGDDGSVRDALATATAQHGRIDVVINNAAYPPPCPAGALPALSEWHANLRVMLDGAYLVTQASVPVLRQHGGGAIVNIASIYGLVGPDPALYAGTEMQNEAEYAAAKGGIVQLTRYWAATLAPDIRVNCIAPGGIVRGQPDSFQERYVARTPLGRMASEEDLKGAIAFLASDLSAYVTGQILAVDGGWTAR